jgi:hypothetical protein
MGTTVLVIAIMTTLTFIFPIGAAYYAFKKGRQGWAIATIVSIFVGMGWLVGVIALMVPAKLEEGELEVQCPKCADSKGFTKTLTVDRETGEEIKSPLLGVPAVIGGVAICAFGGWLAVSLLTTPLPQGANVGSPYLPVLFLFGLGGALLSWGSKTLAKQKAKVKLFAYTCSACGHQWERREDGEEGEGAAAALSKPTGEK